MRRIVALLSILEPLAPIPAHPSCIHRFIRCSSSQKQPFNAFDDKSPPPSPPKFERFASPQEWEQKRSSILRLTAQHFIYGKPLDGLSQSIPAPPPDPDRTSSSSSSSSSSSPTFPNLVVGKDDKPRIVLYRAPHLPFHLLRVSVAMSLPLSLAGLLLSKGLILTVAGSSDSSLAAQAFFSVFFWGFIAMPQLFAQTVVGEMSVLFQEHAIRFSVLNWRGKRTDIDVPLLEVIPQMMEMSDEERQAAWVRDRVAAVARAHGRRLPFVVSLRHGHIPDKTMLANLLEGKTQERFLQRIKAEKEGGGKEGVKEGEGDKEEKITVRAIREQE